MDCGRAFTLFAGEQRIHILLERDGFAKDKAISFDDRGDSLSFELENRGGGDHETTIRISGLTAGKYEVKRRRKRKRLKFAGVKKRA